MQYWALFGNERPLCDFVLGLAMRCGHLISSCIQQEDDEHSQVWQLIISVMMISDRVLAVRIVKVKRSGRCRYILRAVHPQTGPS